MKSNCLSMLHLNIHSLQKHPHIFEWFFHEMKLAFDFIGITESRISKTQSSSNNINLLNDSIEHMPPEATTGGTSLYNNTKFTKSHTFFQVQTFARIKLQYFFCKVLIFRSSHLRSSTKKGVLQNFVKFTGKYLC